MNPDREPRRTLYLVVTGAPLTRWVTEAVPAILSRGWDPVAIMTEAARAWLDPTVLTEVGVPVLAAPRSPDEPKRQPAAAAVLVAPATFNTLNKLAAGIADSYPSSVLAEAVGAGTPTLVVPFVNAKLAGHPAWPETLARLRSAGVMIMDPGNGSLTDLTPIVPGTGEEVAADFDWNGPLDQLGPRR